MPLIFAQARAVFVGLIATLALSGECLAQGIAIIVNEEDAGETILGPKSPQDHEAWVQALRAWRDEERKRIAFNPQQYIRPEILWTQHAYVQPQVMVEDRYLYDPRVRRYN